MPFGLGLSLRTAARLLSETRAERAPRPERQRGPRRERPFAPRRTRRVLPDASASEPTVERLQRAWKVEPGYLKTAIVNAVTRAAHTEEPLGPATAARARRRCRTEVAER